MTENEKRQAPLAQLAAFTAALTWEQLPQNVQQAVVYRVLDLVSVSVGASGDPLVEHLKEAVEMLSGGPPAQGVHLWGEPEGRTWSVESASLLNAMLAHTLELDDVHPASKCHGSACLIPAAWSLGERLQSSGKELLTAVVAGYETAFRIGRAFGVTEHRKRGWHATSTCGVFGAAAACAHLLQLNPEQTANALGLAGSQATGVWAFLGDGTNSKVLNPGQAAAAGLRSALFARAGMTGSVHILEAQDGGLLKAMSDGGCLEQVAANLGETWEILHMDMKPYPCCRSAHSSIDAAKLLRREILQALNLPETVSPKVLSQKLRDLQVGIYQIGYAQCAYSEGCLRPQTPLEVRFSLPYTVACALLYGRVDQSLFTQREIRMPLVQQLMTKIQVKEDPELTAAYPAHWSAWVQVTLEAGRTFRQLVQDPAGSFQHPLSQEDALAKASGLLAVRYGAQAQVLAEKLLALPKLERLPLL